MQTPTAHNPLLPDRYFIPDVEAHVFNDGRVYLYGSMDIPGCASYCSDEYHVFSSDDLVTWVDHGVSFRLDQAVWYAGTPRALYAPDCVFRNGIYYLYYCVPDGRCGVAKSASPVGPFEDIGAIQGVDGIDPAVFIDDDGQAYLYWGQFDRVRAAKLRDNMTEIIPESVTQPLSVVEHDFHEGSSVRKIDGKYYFIYTDTHRHKSPEHSYGMATCLGYAVSDNPLTGFKYGGVIIDNIGCDPGTWNNHGSLCCFKGQWYIFYHRSTHGFEFSRHVCVEPITVRGGKIDEVMMTSSGVGESLQASQIIPGSWACGLSGNVRIMGQGRTVADSGEYPMILTCIRPGDTASFRYLAFNGETGFHATFSSDGPCHITVLIDGSLVAVTDVHGYANLIQSVFGRHEITLLFDGAFTETSLEKIQFL